MNEELGCIACAVQSRRELAPDLPGCELREIARTTNEAHRAVQKRTAHPPATPGVEGWWGGGTWILGMSNVRWKSGYRVQEQYNELCSGLLFVNGPQGVHCEASSFMSWSSNKAVVGSRCCSELKPEARLAGAWRGPRNGNESRSRSVYVVGTSMFSECRFGSALRCTFRTCSVRIGVFGW